MPLSFSTRGSFHWRPIRRLMAKKVLAGLVTACRRAGWPTTRSPSSRKATTEGVVRAPSAFSITFGVLPSMMATHELVVPRSMPIILLIESLSRSFVGDVSGKPSGEAPRCALRPRFDQSQPVAAREFPLATDAASPADMGEIAGAARVKVRNRHRDMAEKEGLSALTLRPAAAH